MEYRITFDRIGRNHDVAPLETGEVDGPNHLAELVYQYARPYLRSREVDVMTDVEGGRGQILCGFHSGGEFKIEEM